VLVLALKRGLNNGN